MRDFAFRNSFFFDRKILFMIQERMDTCSLGDFVVVILHYLSHIKTGDLKDDCDPFFMREFYKKSKFLRKIFLRFVRLVQTCRFLFYYPPFRQYSRSPTPYQETRMRDFEAHLYQNDTFC